MLALGSVRQRDREYGRLAYIHPSASSAYVHARTTFAYAHPDASYIDHIARYVFPYTDAHHIYVNSNRRAGLQPATT